MTATHLTGDEQFRTERNGPLRRLGDLDQWDVLCAANLMRDETPTLVRALMVWQHRLLKRAQSAPPPPVHPGAAA